MFEARSIIVAQLAFIGDMVFTTPLLSALRDAFSGARLTVVGRPRALEVLADHPAVDGLLPYDKDRAARGAAGLMATARELRRQRAEVFVGVTRSLRTALLARLSGAAHRVGWAGGGRAAFYDSRVGRPPARTPLPARAFALARPLIGAAEMPPLSLAVGERRRAAARAALQQAGWEGERIVAVAPGANYATKRWPEEHVARFVREVSARPGLRVGLYGGPAETELIERLLEAAPGGALDRRGCGIGQMCAEFTQAAVVLCGDSGPLHIARALGRPVVGLFGPTDPRAVDDGRPFRALHLGLECQPCSAHGDARCPLEHFRCLRELAPEEVLAATDELLSVAESR